MTVPLRLCDDSGMISHRPVTDRKLLEPEGHSYLARLNVLRSRTGPLGEHGPIDEPLSCTGSAHLAGVVFWCTSSAHNT